MTNTAHPCGQSLKRIGQTIAALSARSDDEQRLTKAGKSSVADPGGKGDEAAIKLRSRMAGLLLSTLIAEMWITAEYVRVAE